MTHSKNPRHLHNFRGRKPLPVAMRTVNTSITVLPAHLAWLRAQPDGVSGTIRNWVWRAQREGIVAADKAEEYLEDERRGESAPVAAVRSWDDVEPPAATDIDDPQET